MGYFFSLFRTLFYGLFSIDNNDLDYIEHKQQENKIREFLNDF